MNYTGKLNKKDFLKSYSYFTEEECDLMAAMINGEKEVAHFDCRRILTAGNRLMLYDDSCDGCPIDSRYCELNDLFKESGFLDKCKSQKEESYDGLNKEDVKMLKKSREMLGESLEVCEACKELKELGISNIHIHELELNWKDYIFPDNDIKIIYCPCCGAKLFDD